MFSRATLNWILLAGISLTSVATVVTEVRTYAVTQTFELQRKLNGIDGVLQLLLDARLTGPIQEKLWGKGDWSFAFPHDSSIYAEFSALPPGKSKLRIVNGTEKVIAERELETVLAKLEEWSPGLSGNQNYLLTEDYSAGIGSYNGPKTTILNISSAGFHEVTALNVDSKKEEPIRLVKSLKSDWRIPREISDEILSVSCYSDGQGNFVIKYTRYSFDGVRWVEYTRQESGFWESDEAFPSRSAFP